MKLIPQTKKEVKAMIKAGYPLCIPRLFLESAVNTLLYGQKRIR